MFSRVMRNIPKSQRVLKNSSPVDCAKKKLPGIPGSFFLIIAGKNPMLQFTFGFNNFVSFNYIFNFNIVEVVDV